MLLLKSGHYSSNIAINLYLDYWNKKKHYNPELPLQDFIVNVKEMTVVFNGQPDDVFQIRRSIDNNRDRPAARNGYQPKHAEDIKFVPYAFGSSIGEFSERWFREVNGSRKPTAYQIFKGIESHFMKELQTKTMYGKNPALEGLYKIAIKKVREHFSFTDEEMKKELNGWDHD